MVITRDCVFKSLRHKQGSTLFVRGSLTVESVALDSSITLDGVVTILSLMLPDSYLHVKPLMILKDSSRTPKIKHVNGTSGCVDLLSAADPIENVTGITIPTNAVFVRLVGGRLYRLCPRSAPSDYVQCNIATAVYDGSFVSPYCPGAGCTSSLTRRCLTSTEDPSQTPSTSPAST